MKLYDELAPWYRLVDPLEDHAEEGETYGRALLEAVPGAKTLLELGAGAGNTAHYLPMFERTLTDLSPRMLDLSRAINPDCEHHLGDMRTLRLNRTFDTVLVHDAIVYMTTEADLLAAMRTAIAHLRPGGAALFAPDCVSETFKEESNLIETDDLPRSLRCLEWSWDPNPTDTTYRVEYAILLRENDTVRSLHDRHIEGLFPHRTWLELLEEAGFETPRSVRRPLGDGTTDEVFVARTPR